MANYVNVPVGRFLNVSFQSPNRLQIDVDVYKSHDVILIKNNVQINEKLLYCDFGQSDL